tara:strand:+ start:672 stop:1139 length:468 start_codon:yes stop_codon:yes gene_type:complete
MNTPSVPVPENELQLLVDQAARLWEVDSQEILGSRRGREEISASRQACMAILRSRCYALVSVGDAFNRGHETVIYAVKKVKEFQQVWPDFNIRYKKLLKLPRAGQGQSRPKVQLVLTAEVSDPNNLTDNQLVEILLNRLKNDDNLIHVKRTIVGN